MVKKSATPAQPPQCPACGALLKPYDPEIKSQSFYSYLNKGDAKLKPAPDLTADGKPSQWGSRGDNKVCNYVCGHKLLIRLLTAIPDALDLLPPDWRPDLRPYTDSEKVRIANEKAAARRAAEAEAARLAEEREERHREAEKKRIEQSLRDQARMHGWTLVTEPSSKKITAKTPLKKSKDQGF